MRHPGPEDAEAKAELWLREHGITSLPVDPFEIAEGLEIEVRPKDDAEPGVSGMLLRHREAFGILFATHIKSIGFQRFSIGHELGHYLLAGHAEQLFPDGDGIHASRAGFMSNVLHEREADHFACGLLMPDGPFRSALRRCGEGLEAIEALADKCLTSITATAIRYARKTSVPAAVVVSTDGQVDFSFLSGEMREFPGLTMPRKGERVPDGTKTALFALSRDNVLRARREAGEIDLRSWLGGRRNLEAKEEVLGLGGYGRVLTVLTTDFLADDEDEEGGLEESWTPRFRR